MAKKSVPTWEQIVVEALQKCGSEASLSLLYRKVEMVCRRHKRLVTKHYQAKVRQICQKSERIVQDERGSGIWRLVDQAK